ncbi:MAG: type II toxin-antitoxin system Phd/YefM family antitoxin [Anaerolineales bacterium]|nr:type II toxin-antitoxin system Phd/YefM family antitoxin [Anaerolineales bacterium]
MTERYTIAEARHHFAALVHKVEDSHAVEITRRGKAVAVLLSIDNYRKLLAPKRDFWEAYEKLRQTYPFESLEIDPAILNVRSHEPGREFTW